MECVAGKSSVSLFKEIAKKHRTSYQAMIRRILSLDAEKYSQ